MLIAFTKRLALLAPLALGACSSPDWKLMPTPLVHQHLGEKAFRNLSEDERSPTMQVFYATNRPATGPAENRIYENGIVEGMHLGRAQVRFGPPGLRWNELLKISTLGERKEEVPLTLGPAHELDSLPASDGRNFSAAIDRFLAETRSGDITIYVHGAKSTFLNSAVQGAQFHHFMAQGTALIAYSWPSTGSFLRYKKDVDFAAQSASALADLIEFLAANTSAERIHVLAYSAGGQVAGPGLAMFRDRHPGLSTAQLKQKLRLGNIYFAAADVGLGRFTTEYLPKFADLADNVTVTYHREDKVLGLAQRSHDGEIRLGRPAAGALSESEVRSLERLARESKLDAIDMQFTTAERPEDFRAHGHWYVNPWVSSDAILSFLYRSHAADRGLEKKPDSEAWYFPPDYPDRLQGLIETGRAKAQAR